MDVQLTIDSKIQDIVERELNNLVKRYKPKSALALAMNPNTGEILAMVSKPDFDPNHYKDYSSDVYNRNLPIWKSYEPGSTFKSVTFASALELKLFDMFKDTYYDRGYEMVRRRAYQILEGWRGMGSRPSCRYWKTPPIQALWKYQDGWVWIMNMTL